MAEVWEARDQTLGRRVAVKIILPNLAAETRFHERFLSEARSVAALEHENVLPIYDFGEAEGEPYLVMPFLESGTLAERLEAGRGDAGAGDRVDPPARLRARRRARGRRPPPRREAGERDARRRRPIAARRLRHRQVEPERRPHRDRHRAGDARLHGARARARRRQPPRPPIATRSACSPTSSCAAGRRSSATTRSRCSISTSRRRCRR